MRLFSSATASRVAVPRSPRLLCCHDMSQAFFLGVRRGPPPPHPPPLHHHSSQPHLGSPPPASPFPLSGDAPAAEPPELAVSPRQWDLLCMQSGGGATRSLALRRAGARLLADVTAVGPESSEPLKGMAFSRGSGPLCPSGYLGGGGHPGQPAHQQVELPSSRSLSLCP